MSLGSYHVISKWQAATNQGLIWGPAVEFRSGIIAPRFALDWKIMTARWYTAHQSGTNHSRHQIFPLKENVGCIPKNSKLIKSTISVVFSFHSILLSLFPSIRWSFVVVGERFVFFFQRCGQEWRGRTSWSGCAPRWAKSRWTASSSRRSTKSPGSSTCADRTCPTSRCCSPTPWWRRPTPSSSPSRPKSRPTSKPTSTSAPIAPINASGESRLIGSS